MLTLSICLHLHVHFVTRMIADIEVHGFHVSKA